MSLKDIKGKIKSVARTRKVTKAMEAVSAIKMRKSQMRALAGRPYANAALSVLEQLSVSLANVKHPLTEEREVKKVAIVVMTSDKGLCGVLNAGVLKNAELHCIAECTRLGVSKESIAIYAFGKKGAEYFERRGYTIHKRFENVSDDVTVADLTETADAISHEFQNGTYDRVYVAYTGFKSTFEQRPTVFQILPIRKDVLQKTVKFIVPKKGKYADIGVRKSPAFYTIEPSPKEVLRTLLPRLVSVMLYHALLEMKASEHSARMVAMKNASDKSRDLSRSLTRKFNKERQAVITREVSEIVGGIEALANQ